MVNAVRALISIVISVGLLAGCANGSKPVGSPSSSSPATNVDVAWTTVWSAARGINLFGRGAELIRATMEASTLVQILGPDHTFRGYANSIGPRPQYYTAAVDKNYGYLREGAKANGQSPVWFYRRIVDFQESGSHVSGTVCGYSLPDKNYPEKSRTGISVLNQSYEVSLTKSTSSQNGVSSLVDNHTNYPGLIGKVPTWDVFMPWTITKIHFNSPDDIPPSCTEWWKSAFPDSVKKSDSNEVERSGVVPTSPDLPQYPRWISPGDSR